MPADTAAVRAYVEAQAQGTGTIQGRVYKPATKEYVNNAEVRLEGTGQITYSESDGSFRFSNVPAGTANITVSFIGYNTAKESFTVAAGQTAVRDINLISTAAAAARRFPMSRKPVTRSTRNCPTHFMVAAPTTPATRR